MFIYYSVAMNGMDPFGVKNEQDFPTTYMLLGIKIHAMFKIECHSPISICFD